MPPENRGNQASPNLPKPANRPGPSSQASGSSNQPPLPPYRSKLSPEAPAQLPYQPYNPGQGQSQFGPPSAPYRPMARPGQPGNPRPKKKAAWRWAGLVGGLAALAAISLLIIIPIFNRSTRTEADPFAADTTGGAATATTPNAAFTSPITTLADSKEMEGTTAVIAPAGESTGSPPAAPANTTATRIVAKGEFSKVDAIHYARGMATLGVGADGKTVLRFDNFTSAQGPDLKVYLGLQADGSKLKEGGLNLGPLPATDGSYNISLPDNLDLTRYKSVVIWCEAFSVTFSVASLA
jgi:hypothetical protein